MLNTIASASGSDPHVDATDKKYTTFYWYKTHLSDVNLTTGSGYSLTIMLLVSARLPPCQRLKRPNQNHQQ